MTADAQRIKNAFERQHRLQTPHDETTKNFLEKLQEDIQKTILEKYPYLEPVAKEPTATELAREEALAALNIQMRGYAFDSLVMRYEKARDAQMRAEQIEERRSGGDGGKAQRRAERDKMRFIQILDEVIGDHD